MKAAQQRGDKRAKLFSAVQVILLRLLQLLPAGN